MFKSISKPFNEVKILRPLTSYVRTRSTSNKNSSSSRIGGGGGFTLPEILYDFRSET